MGAETRAAGGSGALLAAFALCLLCVSLLAIRLDSARAQGEPSGCDPEVELCLLDGPAWLAPQTIRYEGPLAASGFRAVARQRGRTRALERIEVVSEGPATKTWRAVMPAGLKPAPTSLRASTESPQLRRSSDGAVRRLASKPRVSIARAGGDRVAQARIETRGGGVKLRLELVLRGRYPAEKTERVGRWTQTKRLRGAGAASLRLRARRIEQRCRRFASCELEASVEASALGYRLGGDRDGARVATPPERPRGSLGFVPAHTERTGGGRRYSYAVYVERGLKVDKRGFAKAVGRTLADRRGWTRTGRVSFRGVSKPGRADTRIILASPRLVDRMCAPLPTNGYTSCTQGSSVILNLDRWRHAVPHFRSRLEYRRMVTNHEVGHRIGQGHRNCPGSGRRAPVMQQQTLGLQGCRTNAWPLGSEARTARATG